MKFVPTANEIDHPKLNTELEEYWKKLWLMWNFRNNEKSFVNDVIRPKSSFSSSNKDVISLLMVKKPKVSFDIGSVTIKEKHIF